jgi:hypothetical protein
MGRRASTEEHGVGKPRCRVTIRRFVALALFLVGCFVFWVIGGAGCLGFARFLARPSE